MNCICINALDLHRLSDLAAKFGIPGSTLRWTVNKLGLGLKYDGIWHIQGDDFWRVLKTLSTPEALSALSRLTLQVPDDPEDTEELQPGNYYRLSTVARHLHERHRTRIYRAVRSNGTAIQIKFGQAGGTVWAIRGCDILPHLKAVEDKLAAQGKPTPKPSVKKHKPRRKLKAEKRKTSYLADIVQQVGVSATLVAPNGLVIHPDREYRLGGVAASFSISKPWLREICRDAGIITFRRITKGQPVGVVWGKDILPVLRKALANGKDTCPGYATPEPSKVIVPLPPKPSELEIEPPNPTDKKPMQVYRPETPEAALNAYRLCNLILSRCHANIARSVVRALVKAHLNNEQPYDPSDLHTLLKKVGAEGGLLESPKE